MSNTKYTEEQYAHAIRLVLDDGKSVKSAAEASGVGYISLYARLNRNPRWQDVKYLTPTSIYGRKHHTDLFKSFYEDCIKTHKMPVKEALEIWNTEYKDKQGYRPCRNRALYYIWVNRFIKGVHYTPRRENVPAVPALHELDRPVTKEVAALAVLLGVSESEIVNRAVRRYKDEVLKNIHSL